jgi:hypothetical protein
MITTIQLKKETAEALKKYKEQLDLDTYDELIGQMLITKTKKSMYGCLGKKTMKEILKGLRDESDRF